MPPYKSRKGKKRQSNASYEEDIPLDENGFIAKGFTISFDDFADDQDFDEDDGGDDRRSRDEAPRGGYGSQVLPVALHLPKDYSGDPEDGDEYLFLVRREAATHPDIKVAQAFLASSSLAASTSVQRESAVLEAVAGPSHRPSIEWRTAFLSRFTNMRETFSNSSAPSKTIHPIPAEYLPIPPAADESSWKSYIYGRRVKPPSTANKPPSPKGKERELDDRPMSDPQAEAHEEDRSKSASTEKSTTGATPSVPASLPGQSSASISTTVNAAKAAPKQPIPVVLQSLDHCTTISLLEHFISWLEERLEQHEQHATPSTVFLPPSMRRRPPNKATRALSASHPAAAASQAKPLPAPLLSALDSQWLFSLLAVLDTFLSSNEIATLRTLARLCEDIAEEAHKLVERYTQVKEYQEQLKDWQESIATAWMVIAAVWEVWGQRDLWI